MGLAGTRPSKQTLFVKQLLVLSQELCFRACTKLRPGCDKFCKTAAYWQPALIHLGAVERFAVERVKETMKAGSLRTRARKLWKEEIRPLAILALVLFSFRSSLADRNDVPSGSMKPTILEGDRVFVNKLAYDFKVPFTTWHLAQWDNPKRGDIVVFYSPHDGKRLVKRVIGLPGDMIELRRDRLFLNGNPVEYEPIGADVTRYVGEKERTMQSYAEEHLPGQTHAVAAIPSISALRDFGPVKVEADHYFMMGDNRDNSFDSRYYGAVARKQILGRATAVVLSFDKEHYWVPRWKRTCSRLN